MNKAGRMLITVALVLAGAMLASTLMLKFGTEDSWLAFVGWVIFFVAIQSPLFISPQSSPVSCPVWLTRLWRKE